MKILNYNNECRLFTQDSKGELKLQMSKHCSLDALYEKAKISPKDLTFHELVNILEYQLDESGCPCKIRRNYDYIHISSLENEKISVYHIMLRKFFEMSISCEKNPDDQNGFSLTFIDSCKNNLSLETICKMTRYPTQKKFGVEGFW